MSKGRRTKMPQRRDLHTQLITSYLWCAWCSGVHQPEIDGFHFVKNESGSIGWIRQRISWRNKFNLKYIVHSPTATDTLSTWFEDHHRQTHRVCSNPMVQMYVFLGQQHERNRDQTINFWIAWACCSSQKTAHWLLDRDYKTSLYWPGDPWEVHLSFSRHSENFHPFLKACLQYVFEKF